MVGCGDDASPLSRSASTAAAQHDAPFDVSFVPDSASRVVVARTRAPLAKAQDVASRIAVWPVLEEYLPRRADVTDTVLHQFGFGWPPGRDLDWMGEEAGAAQLAGDSSEWLVWADIRAGHTAAARRDARSVLRRAPAGSPAVMAIADGRVVLASTQRVMVASRRAAGGSTSFASSDRWAALRPALRRRGGVAMLYAHGHAGVVGADDDGFWATTLSPDRRCDGLPSGDALAALRRRPAGAGVVRASGSDAAADRRQLPRDMAWLALQVRALAGHTRMPLRPGTVTTLQATATAIEHLAALPQAAPQGLLGDDPSFRATAASAKAPDDAAIAYWIDAAVINQEVVADLVRRRMIGSTAAAVARSALQGVDGALVWVDHATIDGRCMIRVGMRLGMPSPT
jgi:hypothetical protein